jgi:hypothetical protein
MDVVLCAQGIPRWPTPPASPPFCSWTAQPLPHLVPIPRTPLLWVLSLLTSILMTPHLLSLCRHQPTTHLAPSSITSSKTKSVLLPHLVLSTFPSVFVPMPSNSPPLQNYQPLLPSLTVWSGYLDAHKSLVSTLTANLPSKFVNPTPHLC